MTQETTRVEKTGIMQGKGDCNKRGGEKRGGGGPPNKPTPRQLQFWGPAKQKKHKLEKSHKKKLGG